MSSGCAVHHGEVGADGAHGLAQVNDIPVEEAKVVVRQTGRQFAIQGGRVIVGRIERAEIGGDNSLESGRSGERGGPGEADICLIVRERLSGRA